MSVRKSIWCGVPHLAALLVLASMLAPGSARAQISRPEADPTWETRPWMGDVAFLSANALLAGLTAGILQELKDGSFRDGFARGALGGAVSYGGRRLAAEDFQGAGLLGRQVSALGISVVRNASEGRPALSRLFVPVGPVILRVQTGHAVRVHARLDLFSAGWLLTALLDERLDFDTGASLSAGAPVFRTRHQLGTADERKNGLAVAGVIVIGRLSGFVSDANVFAHERVHVLQHDFGQTVWGDPLESWLGGNVPVGNAVLRFVRPGMAYPFISGSIEAVLDVERGALPWEIEADYLENR